MARWRLVLWAIRIAFATMFAVFAIRLFVLAGRIPLELGFVIFAPICIVAAVLCLWLALLVVFPRAMARPGLGFWSSLSDLMNPF